MRYRKKPVVIEAHRIGDDGWPDAIWQGVMQNKIVLHLDVVGHPKQVGGHVSINTLEGTMRGEVGDYIIRGVSGEFYPCKPEIFAATYESVEEDTGLSFSRALEALRDGRRIARAGWNGKGMWLAISGPDGPRNVAHENLWSKHASTFARLNGGSAEVLPCILMKTADDKILMGWLASQTDMLADDWMILPEDAA